MPKASGFGTGRYHSRYGLLFGWNPFFALYLRGAYETSREIVERRGWRYPLRGKAPRILLCGVGTSLTAKEFVDFVKARNEEATIHVLDRWERPLESSRRRLERIYGKDLDARRVFFARRDAAKTSFPGGYFDWIETDFFLEYFSRAQKSVLLREWRRILKPRGIVTTRDSMEPEHAAEKLLAAFHGFWVKKIFGVDTHRTTKKDYMRLFHEAGFEAAITPARIAGTRMRLPLMHFICARRA